MKNTMLSLPEVTQAEIDEILEITKILIKAPSVTPYDGGLMKYIQEYMEPFGFVAENYNINTTRNLYLKLKNRRNDPTRCFAGHVDVVPPGVDWKIDPFKGVIKDGIIHGRGASDMKCSIACAMVAMKYLANNHPDLPLSILLTSDEEGDGEDGLKKLSRKLLIDNEKFEFFVLGEPTAVLRAGDAMKVGRRGSVVGIIKVAGKRGHIAYPEFAYNPIPDAIAIAKRLLDIDFDDEIEEFGSSKLQITEMTAHNSAENVIPEEMKIMVGVRFNPNQTFYTITNLIQGILDEFPNASASWRLSGNPFYVSSSHLVDYMKEKVKRATNEDIKVDAKGATSDGRFLCELADVFEIGFVESQAHQVDEQVSVEDAIRIYKIYREIFQGTGS